MGLIGIQYLRLRLQVVGFAVCRVWGQGFGLRNCIVRGLCASVFTALPPNPSPPLMVHDVHDIE